MAQRAGSSRPVVLSLGEFGKITTAAPVVLAKQMLRRESRKVIDGRRGPARLAGPYFRYATRTDGCCVGKSGINHRPRWYAVSGFRSNGLDRRKRLRLRSPVPGIQ